MSSRGLTWNRPRATSLLKRRSSRLNRGSNNVNGAYGTTVAVTVHVVAVPHAPRLRPSDGAMVALGTAHVAFTAAPGRFCSLPLTWTPHHGSGYTPLNLLCVCPAEGG